MFKVLFVGLAFLGAASYAQQTTESLSHQDEQFICKFTGSSGIWDANGQLNVTTGTKLQVIRRLGSNRWLLRIPGLAANEGIKRLKKAVETDSGGKRSIRAEPNFKVGVT